MKENIEIAEKFGADLRNAFDEKQGNSNLFEFDSKHLSFSVTSVFPIERDEKIHGLVQYVCMVEF